jgi:hypothetical protein
MVVPSKTCDLRNPPKLVTQTRELGLRSSEGPTRFGSSNKTTRLRHRALCEIVASVDTDIGFNNGRGQRIPESDSSHLCNPTEHCGAHTSFFASTHLYPEPRALCQAAVPSLHWKVSVILVLTGASVIGVAHYSILLLYFH